MKKMLVIISTVVFALLLLTGVGVCSSISNMHFSPATPSALPFNQNVDITFDYSSTEAGGIRIFPRPMTNGNTTPGYAASGSPLYAAGSSSGTGFFTITGGETTVDQVRFQIYNADQSALLGEFFVPVQYAFPVNFASAPAAPTLTVSRSAGDITLSWTSVPTATGYFIGYAPYPNAEYIEVLDVGKKTSFSFNLFSGSVAYYVVVGPYNANGLGTLSNVEFFTIP